MSEATGNPQADRDWSEERTITEFHPGPSDNNALYKLAHSLPLGLGLLVYVPAYVLRVANPFGSIRYTLTNRRVRVDRGTQKKTVSWVALEDIDDVRVRDILTFTRTGDIELIGKREVLLRMPGLQDPAPAAKTILDAINSRKQVTQVMDQERRNKLAAAAT